MTIFIAFLFAGGRARAGEIRGRVVMGERPAAGVTVAAVPYETPYEEARRQARGGDDPAPSASAVSGPDGTFALPVPAEPSRRFRVRFGGGGAAPAMLDGVFESTESADVGEHLLQKGEALAGGVFDPSGAPVAGAEVLLVTGGDRDDSELAATVTRTRTGADGSFRFEANSPGGRRLTVLAAGYAPWSLPEGRSGAFSGRITLAPGVAIAGRVKPLKGRSAAGAVVRVEGAVATRWFAVSEDGSFAMSDAPRGKVSLVADAGDAGWGEAAGVVLPLPEGRNVTIPLASPAVLEGRVVDAKSGRAVPGATIETQSGLFVRTARSGPDGRYRLAGLPPRAFRLSVDESRYVPFVKRDVAVSPGETRKFDAPLTLA
ncbi:MAG TPA: carboxypeptidase-like regulatory domain-containing protein, partial [Thermoanaerobaculia bacterium]|nr:carboxypeptidase-like regulatory domain-containing protein [Thermoanaerobaculia bacterium]